MDRKGYYLKPGVKATTPGVLFSLVCNPTVTPTGAEHAPDWYSWGDAEVCVSRWRRGVWTPVEGASCDTPAALWNWMEKRGDKHRRNYVVSPLGSETLAVSRHWEHLDSGPVKWAPAGRIRHPKNNPLDKPGVTAIRRVVLSPRTCILDYKRNGCRWVWLSGSQYWCGTEEELAATLGVEWFQSGPASDPGSFPARGSRERAYLWLRAFQELADWWRVSAKAPFGLTASACSVGILRSYIQPKALCTHRDPDVHRLERSACFGGRASVWYYGDIGRRCSDPPAIGAAPPMSEYGSIPGPLTLVDVRSMYPWLLREQAFPVKLWRYTERCTTTELFGWAKSFGVIARVTVQTTVPEYPLRVKEGVIYPVGQYQTTLTGPELLRMRQDGRILAVHAVAVYMLGRPFRDAAGALIAMRERCRQENRPAWELFAKLMANGLGGKLAQRKGEWQPREKVHPPVRFGEWHEVSRQGKAHRKFRAIAGLVWEWQPDTTGIGPYTAAFTYLTAYGRLHLRGLRDACPVSSVVSCDTDGIWLLPDGVDALKRAGLIGGAKAGNLRVVEAHRAGRFFDPRHYWVSDGWVLAGFSRPVVSEGGRWVHDTQRGVPNADAAGAAPCGVSVGQRTSALAIECFGSTVGPDGWAAPKFRRGSLST